MRQFILAPLFAGVVVLCCALVSLAAGAATASREEPTPSVLAEEESARAPVVLDGRMLFRVRGISGYPGERRAQDIAGRIEDLAAESAISPEALRIVDAKDRSSILAADRFIMSVFDGDAAPEGVSRQTLADIYRARIAETITSYRHDRSPRVLLVHTGQALGATALLAALLFLLRRFFRRLDTMTAERFKAKVKGLRIQSFQILEAEHLWAGVRGAQYTLRVLVTLALVLVYLRFVLGLYPWTRSLAQRLFDLLLDPLRTMGLGFLAAVPNLVFLAILIVVVRYVLKMTRLYFAGLEHQTLTLRGFDPEWAMPTFKLVRLLIIAFAVILAYPYVPGSQSDAFKGVSIFVGVILSLGSSSAIANIIAGYSITYRRAFKVGDRVKIADFIGDVTHVRLLVTHLRSSKNEEIVVPNSLILNSHVINYSTLARQHGLILHTTVGIGYEVSWRQVEAMLLEAAARTPGLLREPPPFVLVQELGDFAVTYELNVYTDRPQSSLSLYADLHRNILDLFNEHGVQIMTPAYEGDPDKPKVVPKEKWFEAPARSTGLPPASAPGGG